MKLAEHLPDNASYTQVSTFQRCNFRYWLKYILGVEPRTAGLGLFRGRYLHEAYDLYLFEGRKDDSKPFELVDTMAQADVDDGANPEVVNQAVEEAHVVLTSFLPWADENDNFELLLPLGKKQTKCETDDVLKLKLPDGSVHPFRYKIDAHIRIDGEHLMLENKFRKNLDTNGLEHDLQILLYQAAWNAQHPKDRITGVLYNVVGAKPRKKDGVIAVREYFYRGQTEERIALRNLTASLMNMKAVQSGGYWPMDQRKECNWDCDFVGLCLGVRAGSKPQEYIESGAYRLTERAAKRNDLDEEEEG